MGPAPDDEAKMQQGAFSITDAQTLSKHQSAPMSKIIMKPTNHGRPRHPTNAPTRSLHAGEFFLDLNIKKCDIS